MLHRITLALTLLLASPSLATEEAILEGNTHDVTHDQQIDTSTRELRRQSRFYIGGTYSYIDFLLPGKIGASAEWIRDVEHSRGLEFLHGSLSVPFLAGDLGGFSEQRVSIISRYFREQNSLNLYWLIAYNKSEVKLGSSVLDSIPSANAPSLKLLSHESLGLGFGIGNRWQSESGITWAIDWFSWTQPLISIKTESAVINYIVDERDKQRVRDALKVMNYFPRIAIGKLQVGYSF